VAGAVLELEEPLRTAVLLRFHEELSVREVGRRTGVPYETARARLARALSILRARLRERDGRSYSPGLLLLAGIRPDRVGVGAAAGTGGVILMTKTKIAVVAAVALLLAGGVATWLSGPGGNRGVPVAPGPEAPRPAGAARVGDPAAAASTPSGEADEGTAHAAGDSEVDPEHGACHGRLAYEDGTPVADTPVRLSGSPSEEVVTDADGRFRIGDAWVDSMGRSLWVGPRSGAVSAGNVALRPGEDVTFDATLPAGVPLDVEVLAAADGRPVEGVWLFLVSLDGERRTALGVSDAEGRCRFEHLPRRDWCVRIDTKGWLPHRGRLDLRTGSTPGPLRIHLVPPEPFTLRVVPAPAGRPTVNLSFLPVPEDPVKGSFTVVGDLEDGVFQAEAPPPGRYRAYVRVFGVLQKMIENVRVRPREPLEMTIETEPGVEVRGALVGPDGGGVRGKVVFCPYGRGAEERGAETNPGGEFALADVRPGRYWVNVSVSGQTLSQVVREIEIPSGGLSDLRIRLPEGGGIEGSVVGSPLPGMVSIQLFRFEDGVWKTKGLLRTDNRGRFRARWLPAGRWLVQTSAMRPGLGWAEEVEVRVPAHGTVEVEVPWRENPEVELVVTDASGAPVTAPLEARTIPGGPRGGMTHLFVVTPDESGRATVTGLSPGPVRLVLTCRDPGGSATVEAEIRERDNPPIRVEIR
jgi:hypothetical protein